MASSHPEEPGSLSSPSAAASSPASRITSILRAILPAPTAATEIEAAALQAAAALDALYPAGDVKATEDFLWTLWSELIATAKAHSAADPLQDLLVAVIARLRDARDDAVVLWDQQTRVWTELPMLAPCMRDAWQLRPVISTDADRDKAAMREWISLNAFAARIFAAELQSWVNFAIWELRAGLEEPPPPSNTVAKDMRLATACEWLSHAGRALLEQGRQVQQLGAMEERALKAGSLFVGGKPGLSDDRWRFWLERLTVLGGSAADEALQKRTRNVCQGMVELESSIRAGS